MPIYEGAPDWKKAEAERWRQRMAEIVGYRSAAISGARYNRNESDKELIGIADAVLFWSSESGVDNSTDDAGNSGLHKSIFDTTTRADSAQIKLLNDSGVTQYVTAAAIKAKPIVRLSGEQGFVHDSFVDYESILLNGENTFEFGNNYIVTADQLANLADYFAKALGVLATGAVPSKAKHMYAVSIRGRCYWFEPGELYTLAIGVEGAREHIDCVAECYSMRVQVDPRTAGMTQIIFREVEQGWVKDSNALARFLATGDPRWKPNNFSRVVVAAKNSLDVAVYYCDGTADQTEIQAAINAVTLGGGGMVELTKETFTTGAAIDVNNSKLILSGQGAQTIISKNANDYALEILGTSGTYITDIMIQNLKLTRPAGDTNNIPLVHIKYARNVILDNVIIDDSYGDGLLIENCENVKFLNSISKDHGGVGVKLVQTKQAELLGSTISGCTGRGVELLTEEVTNMVDHGSCEDLDPPVVTGETTPVFTSMTASRSNTVKYAGTYSYKYNKDNAPGNAAQCLFTDNGNTNDMHGATAGKTYKWRFRIYIPSGQIQASEVYFDIYNYSPAYGGWKGAVETRTYPAATYDAWQTIEIMSTLEADATGFVFDMLLYTTAAQNEFIYLDEIYMYECDYENNGYIINDCTIRDNGSNGIYIATNEAEIINNRLIDNDGVSLYIEGGDKNTVRGNEAVRDGDYTAVNNYYDGGTNTHDGI